MALRPTIGMLTGSNDVITDPEQIRSILDPTRFAIGPGFDDQDIFKEPGELDLPDQGADPFETGEFEDSVFDILVAIMAGTQGTIEGLDPETIDALQTVIEGSSGEELDRIAQEIAEQWI